MKIKYAIGAVLMAAVLLVPVQAQSCECAQPLSVSFSCVNEGGGMGSAYSNVSGGVAPYSYQWSVIGATMYGGTGSSVFFRTLNAPRNVTVSLTVTDSCGSSKSYSKSCYVSGGDPFKRALEEDQTINPTVGEILNWLSEIKGADFEVTFKGFSFMDAMASDMILEKRVANIVDENNRVMLILEDDVVFPSIDHEIEER